MRSWSPAVEDCSRRHAGGLFFLIVGDQGQETPPWLAPRFSSPDDEDWQFLATSWLLLFNLCQPQVSYCLTMMMLLETCSQSILFSLRQSAAKTRHCRRPYWLVMNSWSPGDKDCSWNHGLVNRFLISIWWSTARSNTNFGQPWESDHLSFKTIHGEMLVVNLTKSLVAARKPILVGPKLFIAWWLEDMFTVIPV